MARQISEHIAHEGISNENQSAYRVFHSTETALLKIQNDIATSMDKGATVVVLLDLSAAFNTIDHSILFNCFQHCYGIGGIVLKWVKPQLKETADQNRWTSFRRFSIPLWGSPRLSSWATPFYLIYNPSQFSHI